MNNEWTTTATATATEAEAEAAQQEQTQDWQSDGDHEKKLLLRFLLFLLVWCFFSSFMLLWLCLCL